MSAQQRKISLVVSDQVPAQQRLDKYLAEQLAGESFSRSHLERLIKGGVVSINGTCVESPAFRLSPGTTIELDIPEPRELELQADSSVPFKVVYRDSAVMVIDKPAGVIVHPGAGAKDGTLVAGLIHLLGEDLPQLGGAYRPGIVHRLDKDTSGLMVIALTEQAWINLQQQFRPPRKIHRTYLAVTMQAPSIGGKGTISIPIGRDQNSRIKMSSRSSNAKEAVTHWEIHQELKHGLVISCELETGRTHQIRVHLAESGAPIIGDPVYGARLKSYAPEMRQRMGSINRQALHAQKLSFLHPETGERIYFESELPHDIIDLIAALDR